MKAIAVGSMLRLKTAAGRGERTSVRVRPGSVRFQNSPNFGNMQPRHSLVAVGGVQYADGGVVGAPGELLSRGGELDVVHPAAAAGRRRAAHLGHQLAQRHLGPPAGGARLTLDVLNVGGEHPHLTGDGQVRKWAEKRPYRNCLK